MWDILHVKTLEMEHGVPESEVRRAIRDGRLGRDDCVRPAGQQRWVRIHESPELRDALGDGSTVKAERAGPPPRLTIPATTPTIVAEPAEPGGRRQPSARPSAPHRPAPPTPAGPTTQTLFRRRREEEPEDIDMAPAATLAFLLILFFIVASTVVIQKAVEFPKPSSDENTASPTIVPLEEYEADNIIVRIRHDNTILVDGEETSPLELQLKLTNLKRERAVDGLIIRADERAYHQTVIAVMDAATLANISNIRVATVHRRGAGRSRERPRRKS